MDAVRSDTKLHTTQRVKSPLTSPLPLSSRENKRTDKKDKKEDKTKAQRGSGGDNTVSTSTFPGDEQGDKRKFLAWNPSFFEWGRAELMCTDPMLMTTLLAPDTMAYLNLQFSDPGFLLEYTSGWLGHVVSAAHGQVLWHVLPGYSLLLEACLLGILQRPDLLTSGTGRRIQCLLLSSDTPSPTRAPIVLRTFVELRLRQTSVNDAMGLNQTLDCLDDWIRLASGEQLSDPLPENFCYDTLLFALQTALRGHHFQMLIKTLTFLYMHLGRFYRERRSELLQHVVFHRSVFFRLFLHWCPEVRRVFQLLLTYRVLRSTNTELSMSAVNVRPRVPKQAQPLLDQNTGPEHNSDRGKNESGGGLKSIIREVFSLWGQKDKDEVSVLCEGDPGLESCVLVTSELPREERQLDHVALSLLNCYMSIIHTVTNQDDTSTTTNTNTNTNNNNNNNNSNDPPKTPIRTPLQNSAKHVIPVELAAYATEAITEFHAHIQSFLRLQLHHSRTTPKAKSTELLVPLLYFQIASKHGIGS